MEYQIKGELLFFDCEQCNASCMTLKGDPEFFRRTFCDNCGACYALYLDVEGNKTVRRITYGEMYLPPLEWNNLYGTGLSAGMQLERTRRRNSPFWWRFKTFIRNL